MGATTDDGRLIILLLSNAARLERQAADEPACDRRADLYDAARILRRDAGQRTYADGAALGCPDCDAGEPHVCPFLHADRLPEPRRTAVLDHIRAALADDDV